VAEMLISRLEEGASRALSRRVLEVRSESPDPRAAKRPLADLIGLSPAESCGNRWCASTPGSGSSRSVSASTFSFRSQVPAAAPAMPPSGSLFAYRSQFNSNELSVLSLPIPRRLFTTCRPTRGDRSG
jgi:hypothetical protein